MASSGKGGIAAKVWKLAEPFAQELGLSLWDVQFCKEGADWFLRIYIDKEGGVDMNDCVAMTHAVNKPLDEADPIDQSYCLEVCSPGLERELTRPEHFEKMAGQPVKIHLIRPRDGRRDWKGTLLGLKDGVVSIRTPEGDPMEVNKKETAWIRLDDFGGLEND